MAPGGDRTAMLGLGAHVTMGRRLPWPLRLLQALCWLSLLGAVVAVVAVVVLAGGHDVLDPSGRWAWTMAAVLAATMVTHTVLWLGSIIGAQAWRRRYYQGLARRAHSGGAAEESYTGYKIASVEATTGPPAASDPTSGAFGFRPLNQRATAYGIDATSWCPREGAGVLCSGAQRAGHICGFHAVRMAELIGPGSPAQVEWDWDRRRRRSQVLLQVSLSGDVEPGEWGYRATEQQVLRVGFQRECIGCQRSRPAEYLTVKPLGAHALVVPVCARHRQAPSFRPVDLANWLGTEVGWIGGTRP